MAESSLADKLVAIEPANKPYVSVTWQVSDVCNYRCSYCNEGNWGAKNKNRDTATYIEVLRKIIRHYRSEGYENFKFFFSGGEPTIWPPFLEVLSFLRAETKNPILAVNTNFSQTLQWWEKNHEMLSDVVASFHIESVKPDRYMENAKYLQDKMPYLCFRMLMHDARFDEVVAFSERIKAELDNYAIEYAPLLAELTPHSVKHLYQESWKQEFLRKAGFERQIKIPITRSSPHIGHSVERYADGRTEALNSNRIVATERNRFKGWLCNLSESIFIGPAGDINLASCGVGGRVGNILEGTVNLSPKPAICPHEVCNCGTDICITKIHPDYVKSKEPAHAAQPHA
jgi:organic radical activating enzyme